MLVADRDRVAAALREDGIETGLHYPVPVHRLQAFADLGLGPGSFPVAERIASEGLSLPLYPELAPEQVDFVAARLTALVRG